MIERRCPHGFLRSVIPCEQCDPPAPPAKLNGPIERRCPHGFLRSQVNCEKCAELDRAPALVVSDMWMPGPCGAAAIAFLKGKSPGTQLIAVSGHFGSGQGCSPQDALGAGAARALAKPVKRADLLAAVSDLIGPPE